MATPVPDLIYGALAEIRVARGGDVVRAEDQALVLGFLNEILERLAVTPHALYRQQDTVAVLTPGLGIHTLGPTGVIPVPRRPVRILAAVLDLPGGTTRQPLVPRSQDWWDAIRLPTLTSAIPESYVYNPAWPDGGLGLYPIPSQALPLHLVTWTEILAVADTDTIDLPPGYGELLRLWTAKKAAPSFAREFAAASQQALTECLAEVFGTNSGRVNDADTRDGGVPGGRGGTYDYRTGQVA
jgi:hypothetical protein